jgi:hypothetical protein
VDGGGVVAVVVDAVRVVRAAHHRAAAEIAKLLSVDCSSEGPVFSRALSRVGHGDWVGDTFRPDRVTVTDWTGVDRSAITMALKEMIAFQWK